MWEQEEEQDFFSSYSCFLLPFHKNKLSNFDVLPRNPWASCNSDVQHSLGKDKLSYECYTMPRNTLCLVSKNI